jgi:Protein of unknown function (DUF2384)
MPPPRKPSPIVQALPPSQRKPVPDPNPPPALHRSQATSTAFWKLMDRWGVPDEKALQLLDHVGGLTAAGKRPRFAMTGDEAKRFAHLMEIDTNLRAVVSDAPGWLVRKNQAFGDTTPLEQMTSGERGMARVHRFLVRTAMLR